MLGQKDICVAQSYAKDIICACIRTTGLPKTQEEWDILMARQDKISLHNVNWQIEMMNRIDKRQKAKTDG